MHYFESEVSRQLYKFNKNRILTGFSPNVLYDKSVFLDFISTAYKLRDTLKPYIFSSIYDKKESDIDDYNFDTAYEYNVLPKIIIYTCILGGYDVVKEPFFKNKLYDFVLITDSPQKKISSWKSIYIKDLINIIPTNLDNISLNRWVKMHPHKLFPEYEYSIYIDGSVTLVADMLPIILSQEKEKKFLGMHLHSCRTFLMSEARALLKCKKCSDKNALNQQIEKYYKEGFDDSIKLLEATIIVRKHNDGQCVKIMEEWWNEFIGGVPRDQISLPYVLWKNGIKMEDIYILGNNEYRNPRFYINKHNV